MIILGLTGPTGAGKSEVAAYLRRTGAIVANADAVAREVVLPGHPCLAALVDAFGEGILSADGTLNRPALAAVAFANKESQQRLNNITHPFIIRRCLDILNKGHSPYAVIDAPLLFESGMDSLCDVTVAVLAPTEDRLSRIMARDHITREQALSRMHIQPDDTFYRERATHILTNNTDLSALHAAVDALIRTVWEDIV